VQYIPILTDIAPREASEGLASGDPIPPIEGEGHPLVTELLQPMPTGITPPTAPDDAANTDQFADLEAPNLSSQSRHSPEDLMPRYEGEEGLTEVPPYRMQIGVADATVEDIERYIIGA
jgi:hypothetical protein